MRSVGPETTTANPEGSAADNAQKQNAEKDEKKPEVHAVEPQQHQPSAITTTATATTTTTTTTTTTNVIPTSPQYGVAIIANSETETATQPTETVTETTAKAGEEKDLHSTPSRTNDRFKVVKIASLEPFKRGRWKCMDYVDEAPPPSTQASKVPTQSAQMGATMYLQTQSLPQQHIQQMLMQGNYPNAALYAGGVIPHTQYFYPQGAQAVPNAGIPLQFISTTQPYFQAAVPNSAGFTMPQSYQYVAPNVGAFVPTTQNFQPGQTYAGQPQQPLVNGHNFNSNEQQNGTNLPTQPAKSVILNSNQMPPQNQQQYQVYQPTNIVPVQQNQGSQTVVTVNPMPQNTQNLEPNSVYTNPQFVASVNSLPVLEGTENASGETSNEATTSDAAAGDNPDDPAKTNPVVNAIDNKIEQAMDLVKSHLMYTVREEVEVLKEKIAELMERIQQLETENNFLRSQIPKNQQNQNTGGTPDPPAQ